MGSMVGMDCVIGPCLIGGEEWRAPAVTDIFSVPETHLTTAQALTALLVLFSSV